MSVVTEADGPDDAFATVWGDLPNDWPEATRDNTDILDWEPA